MELEAPKIKKNTGLLPQFENLLATSSREDKEVVDREKLRTDFLGIRKALRRLFDQAKAITKGQLVQEMADLLQARLGVDYLVIAEIGDDTDHLNIIGGRSKSGRMIKGPFPLMNNSPFDEALSGNCMSYSRNALIQFANNPYMLKYNVNGLIAYPISIEGKVVGLMVAMDIIAIHHTKEVCQLFAEYAPELAALVFTQGDE